LVSVFGSGHFPGAGIAGAFEFLCCRSETGFISDTFFIPSGFDFSLSPVFRRGEKAALGEGLRKALGLYLPLFVFWLIETVIIFIVLFSLTVALKENVAGSPRLRFVFEYGYQLFAYIFSAFLIYTIPGIIISGKNLGRALKDSIKLCSRNFFLTFFIIAIPGSVGAVIDIFISGFTPQIISLFDPELVVIILYVRIALGIFINLFIYGAAVFVHGEMGEKR
jgi:hypothetical protein